MVADPVKHVGQPGVPIDVVQLGGDDERLNRYGPVTMVIRATMQMLGLPGCGTLKQALIASVEQPSTITDDIARKQDEIGVATGRSKLDLIRRSRDGGGPGCQHRHAPNRSVPDVRLQAEPQL
jgi:hypothetical protein